MIDRYEFPDSCRVLPEKGEADPRFSFAGIHEVLDHPVDYPALSAAIVPGDKVAVAVSSQIPKVGSILEPVLEYLSEVVESPADLTLVFPSPKVLDAAKQTLTENAWQALCEQATVTTIDPTDAEALAYLGVDQVGNPAYVCREVFDADVVVPITRQDLANRQTSMGVFPDFCFTQRFEGNEESIQIATALDFDNLEPNDINDRLGIFFACEVVVGPGNDIRKVIAGERRQVQALATSMLDQIWKVEIQSEPDLVVATVEGEADEQSWRSFCDALGNAGAFSANCPVLVLTELHDKPPKDLEKAIQGELSGSPIKVRESWHQLFVDEVGRRPIHLQSNLPADFVENLGLGFVAENAEVQRLIDRAESCVVLRDAHRCHVQQTVERLR